MQLSRIFIFVLSSFVILNISASDVQQKDKLNLEKRKPDFYVYGMDIQKKENLTKTSRDRLNKYWSSLGVNLELSEYIIKLLFTTNRSIQQNSLEHLWVPSEFVFDENGKIKKDFLINLNKTAYHALGTSSYIQATHFRIAMIRSKL